MPGKYPAPDTGFELDGDALQGGVNTRDGQEQERDSCHKSGPGLMSERPWRKAQRGPGVASYEKEEVWSGDASLQQTSVLGPGDGCATKPEGNANEIQGVVADCYKGRPGSGGSSLGSMSHLQSSGRTCSVTLLPQTRTHSRLNKKTLGNQVACCASQESTFESRSSCGEMDESEISEMIPGVCVTETAAGTVQNAGLGSLVSKVSWIVQDAGRLLWHSPIVLQQVREEGLQPVGTRLSSHVVSFVKDSNVLSVVKDSRVFSMVKGSFVFSLLKDSHIFSMVKKLPLVQHIHMEINQHLQAEEAAQKIQDCINPDTQQNMANTVQLPLKHICVPKTTHLTEHKEDVKIFCQRLIKYPDFLCKLQTLPLPNMMDALQAVIPTSVLTSQKIVAFFWLKVAKCSQPKAHPALLVLMETGLYALTADSEPLVLFHHLPLLQLKEVQIGLAGHSLRFTGPTEESILCVYTHSQMLTKELCRAIFGVICPGDSRVAEHPLLHGDLMKMSLDWKAYVPDLLLDAGLKVCCQFQKSLSDLVYLLHCNMDQSEKTVSLGEIRILMYTTVGVCISHSTGTESLVQLLLTDTHLGLLQEDAVFYPTPRFVCTAPCRPRYCDLVLHQRSDIRCVLVRDEDKHQTVRMDVILANVKGRGHPESVAETSTLSKNASDSSLRGEVWKLTFSCSAEAACLINHLSNV